MRWWSTGSKVAPILQWFSARNKLPLFQMCAQPDHVYARRMSSSSTSKTRSAFGGMALPAPFLP